MSSEFLDFAYNPVLVFLSMGVAAAASFVALDVAARIWLSHGWARTGWIAAASTAMGGGIWSMHFIAMLAFSLPITVRYDVPTTLASLAIAIAVTAAGFTIVAVDRRWPRLLAAGAVMGLGVAAMHYVGMSAMRLQAMIEYTPWIFIASVLIACVSATVALWIALRTVGLLWRAGAALVMGAAVSGMHYTGMTAACFSPVDSILSPGAAQFERGHLALLIALGTLVILALELVSAAIDRRFSAFRMREAEILRLSAQRFQHLVQSSNDLILVVDRTGAIEFAPASSRTRLDLIPSDMEHRNIFQLVTGAGIEALRAVLTAQEEHAAFAFVDRLQLRDRDGTVRQYEATVCNLLDEPSVRGIALTFHDVTEREQTAEQLLRAKEIADEANRLKSEFIANMNHELRTPLNAILGFSEMMARDDLGKLSGGKYREYAGDIHHSAAQLLAIITDILDWSKAEAAQIVLSEDTIDAGWLLGDSVRFVRAAAARKNIRIDSVIPPSMPSFRGDERRLRQILLNLLSNAVKFTGKDGQITARVAQSAYGELEFCVQDTGIGIPDDKLARVFEPFFQIDGSLSRQQEGTGLGLAIARTLAELHGGRLTLESRIGQGTLARLTLPQDRLLVADAA